MRRGRLALRLLRRDWRAGEVRLLAAAVVVAVAAVTAVAWLADRVAGASGVRAAELLAADRAVRTSEPIPDSWLAEARRLGLETARMAEFPSVVLAGDRTQLVGVKAVEAPYPLRGALQVQRAVGAPAEPVRTVPAPGTAWVESRLLGPLEIALGDALSLGARSFTVDRLLALEPDRGGFFSSLAPRVLINYDDLAATRLIQPGSRVRYQLLLAGPAPALEQFRRWLPDAPGLHWRTPEDSGLGIREVLERAERFLGLAALLTVVIAGVAILLTVRRYAERQVDRVAIMRCMGATAADVTALMTWKLVWLGLFAGALGVALGFLLHLAMLGLVANLLPPEIPAPRLYPAAAGWFTAFAALLGFALPTVLRLRRVPPLRVLRRELGSGLFGGSALYLVALAVIFLLMWWQADDPRLAGLVFAAVLGTLALLGLAAWLIVRGLVRLRGGSRRLLWLSGITRRPATASVQIVAIGVGLMALLLLTLVRQDLLAEWQGRIPPDASNYFLINVQPGEVDALRALIRERAGVEPQFYPMIRGRLVAIDGRAVSPDQYEDRARRLVAREFNLSYGERPPADNRVTAGRWWGTDATDPRQFSVEVGIAQDLGIGLGDRLRFVIGADEVEGTVTSLREVQWDSFNVNFFVMAPPGLLDPYPTTFITSFHLPPGNEALLADLVRAYPSVTLFDINGILATVRGIIGQGARVVELMAALTLIAGVVVLLAALQTTGEERRFESALLRALGARRGHIKRLARAEFWLIGAAAGGLAGVCAAIAGLVMARELFGLDYALDPRPLVAGLVAGPLVVWLAGAWATRRFYRAAPMRLLRGGAE